MPTGAENSGNSEIRAAEPKVAADSPYINKADYEKAVLKAGQLEQANSQLTDVAKRFEATLKLYNSDAEFKKSFDNAWARNNGGKKEESKPGEKVTPEAELRSQLAEANAKIQDNEKKINAIGSVQNLQLADNNRNGINSEYTKAFNKLAKEKGYRPNTPAYDNLFKATVSEGRKIAPKFNLINQFGVPDPLLQFNPQLLSESFNSAYNDHKRMNFDINENEKQRVEEERKKKMLHMDDWMKPMLDKKEVEKKYKGTDGRAQQLKDLVNASLVRKYGTTLETIQANMKNNQNRNQRR